MEKLNIKIPEASFVPIMFGSFIAVNHSIRSSQSRSSGGSDGGGGIGGGGASGR